MENYTPTARRGWKYFAQQVWRRPKGKRILLVLGGDHASGGKITQRMRSPLAGQQA